MQEEFLKEVLFPYDKIRDYQDLMVQDVHNALKEKKSIIMHAPTGVGKTASVLGPALAHAIKNNLTVIFLTSRHMQHQIVIKTLKEIKEKYNIKINCADLIGKKWMCSQYGVESMYSSDFHQFCKGLREEEKCEFYTKTRNKNNSLTVETKVALDELKKSGPCDVHEIIKTGEKNNLCPYELAIISGQKANVIISDYYYFFNDAIRQSFMFKINKELENCILIVDEGHNLPQRIRELLTSKLSSFVLERALKEAKKYNFSETIENLTIVNNALIDLEQNMEDPQELIDKNDFLKKINKEKDYKKIIDELSDIGEEIIEKQKSSFVLIIARFMESWLNEGEVFTRILTKNNEKNNLTLTIKCLSPEMVSKEVINGAYSTILMSGTLTPTSMYKDILGFPEDTTEKEYQSPFPKKNRLVMVVPRTTTKFSQRSNIQFQNIGKICADICSEIKGNSLIFFPSYNLMNFIGEHFKKIYKKTVFMEKQKLNKAEKEDFIENFKRNNDSTLLAVSSGSFGEGLDMPGILKAVIVVGLPLQIPDLETKELIRYYQEKFQKGWDYGYVLPALTKSLQNAGRCIRSEKDKGALIFLDERYAWNNYLRCFPRDWDVKIESDYSNIITEFFD